MREEIEETEEEAREKVNQESLAAYEYFCEIIEQIYPEEHTDMGREQIQSTLKLHLLREILKRKEGQISEALEGIAMLNEDIHHVKEIGDENSARQLMRLRNEVMLPIIEWMLPSRNVTLTADMTMTGKLPEGVKEILEEERK